MADHSLSVFGVICLPLVSVACLQVLLGSLIQENVMSNGHTPVSGEVAGPLHNDECFEVTV